MSLFRCRFRAMFITQDDALTTALWEKLSISYDTMMLSRKEMPGTSQANDALDAICTVLPDIVVMELGSDVKETCTRIRQIRGLTPHTHAVIVAKRHAHADIIQALQAGAIGYVYDDDIETTLIDVMQAALQERGTLDAAIADAIYTQFQHGQSREHTLTSREHSLLRYLAKGVTVTELARQEAIPETVIHSHLGNIILKMSADADGHTCATSATHEDSIIQQHFMVRQADTYVQPLLSYEHQPSIDIFAFPFFSLLLAETRLAMEELANLQNSAFWKRIKRFNLLPLWFL